MLHAPKTVDKNISNKSINFNSVFHDRNSIIIFRNHFYPEFYQDFNCEKAIIMELQFDDDSDFCFNYSRYC